MKELTSTFCYYTGMLDFATTTIRSQQSSLLLKIIMVQWMNIAFIIWIIKPMADMLTENYIEQISYILWADGLTQPFLLQIDLPGMLCNMSDYRNALVSHYRTLTLLNH
jgi:hypothetical protein